jgi:pantoate--beta-alanine ligase
MELVQDLTTLRRRVRTWRQAGDQIALVPTMGNLHRGHLRLVQEARAYAQRTVVSVFVNPLQFGPDEDFDAYPRTLTGDRALLEAGGSDLLFAPTLATVYPRPPQEQTRVEVPGLSDVLCGARRPGHFIGVATVVCKLFNMVQPDLAVFGEKDFQQLLVIRRMTEDLCLPVGILGVPTVREADGLALSSRNGYLLPEERTRAPALRRTLGQAAEGLQAGRSPAEVERAAVQELRAAGLQPDYVSVCRAADLAPAEPRDTDLVILAAAWLGKARLIDNLRLSRPA